MNLKLLTCSRNLIFRFPIEHFGKLMGLMNLIAAGVQFMQFPLLMWAEDDSFSKVIPEV